MRWNSTRIVGSTSRAGGRVRVADRGVAWLDGAAVALLLQRELVGQGTVGVLPAVGTAAGCPRSAGSRLRRPGAGPGGPTAARSGSAPACVFSASLSSSRPNSKNWRSVYVLRTGCPGRRSTPSARWSRCGARASSSPPAAGSRRGASRTGSPSTTVHTPSPSTHEAEGVLRVPVLRRVLARHQVLDRRPQRRRRERPSAQARVGQRDRAPLAAAADRDEVAGLRRRARAGCPTATGAAPPSTRGCSGIRSPISVHSGTSSSRSKPR